METDDPALGLSAVESALPPSRGVCVLWPGSLLLLFLFLCCSFYRPPLQSTSFPSQNILSMLSLHTVTYSDRVRGKAKPQPHFSECKVLRSAR